VGKEVREKTSGKIFRKEMSSIEVPLIGSSTSDDPFYAFRDELQAHVQKASTRFAQWKHLLETTDTAQNKTFQSEHASLNAELKSLQNSASDLDQVLKRVQTHRSNFSHISDGELSNRQAFMREIKNEIRSMQASMNSPQTVGKLESDAKKDLLRRSKQNSDGGANAAMAAASNSAFIEDQQQLQLLAQRQQDEHLDELEQGATRLGHMATAIGEEIDSQNLMLDDLQDDVEAASTRLEATLSKMDKILKSNSRCQTWTILTLIAVLILLILLVAWT